MGPLSFGGAEDEKGEGSQQREMQAGLQEEEGACPSHAHGVEQGPAGAESSPDAHAGAGRVTCSLYKFCISNLDMKVFKAKFQVWMDGQLMGINVL